jgi:predicted DNA-binding protein (MmcQ/YjbR family)
MTRQEIIEYCLTFPAAYEDYPFAGIPGEGETAVMRHRANKKSFALIMRHNGQLYLNLKCDPFEANFLRQAYCDLIPAWHQNKTHWNTIVVGGDHPCDVPDNEIKRQIGNSYNLIKPKVRNRNEHSNY